MVTELQPTKRAAASCRASCEMRTTDFTSFDVIERASGDDRPWDSSLGVGWIGRESPGEKGAGCWLFRRIALLV